MRTRRARPRTTSADDSDAEPAKTAIASSHEFIVLVDTDDPTSLRMATELVNAAKAAGLKARAWAGKTSPGALAHFVETDGGDFALAAIDALADDPKAADLRAKAPLVARLANEPVVVIAKAGVVDVKQLDGRPVSFGEDDGVVDASGQALFAKLGVAPKVVHEDVSASLRLLTAGKIDAMVMLGADEIARPQRGRQERQAARAGSALARRSRRPLRARAADLQGSAAPRSAGRRGGDDRRAVRPARHRRRRRIRPGRSGRAFRRRSVRAEQAAHGRRLRSEMARGQSDGGVGLAAPQACARLDRKAPRRGRSDAGFVPKDREIRGGRSGATATAIADKLYGDLLRSGSAQP